MRLTNWHTGAREVLSTGGSTATGPGASTGGGGGAGGSVLAGTIHGHVEALAASDAELYRAPGFFLPAARPAGLDVFSLGALALLILTGTPVRQLRQQLTAASALDPSAVADGIDPGLVDLVINATWVDPAARFASVAQFLEALDVVEAD